MMRLTLILCLLLASAPAWALETAPVSSQRAVATLVSETDAVAPGKAFRVGLRLRLAPGWHTYWQNPGDAGVGPELSFALPPGLTAGPVAWPTPARQPEGPLMTYGYSGELLLPVSISGGPGLVRLHATWLVCANICVPEEGDFALNLPAGVPAPSLQAGLFATADASSPQASHWQASISPDGTLLVRGDAAAAADAWVMPAVPDMIVASAPQVFTPRDHGFALALKTGPAFKPGAGLDGVLVVRDRAGGQTALRLEAVPAATDSALPLPTVLGLALLGGLILNLMPCVFPVLAMKAVALAGLSGRDRGHAWRHALAYAAGVLASFSLVGFIILGLRHAGAASGWGFQFQSPLFVAAMSLVLFALGLNLSGVYAMAGVSAGQSLAGRAGLAGSFFTGLLAVLVATPCTAPFMGAAIAAGLAGSPAMTLAVFLAMGVGLAAPYVVLASNPRVIKALPRPGRWMEVLRQALAFPMYGASVWLVWVLSQQAGPNGVLAAGAGMLLVGLAGWAFGLAQRGPGRRVGLGVAMLAGLSALGVLCGLAAMPSDARTPPTEAGVVAFSPERFADLRAEGRPVLVNMTAAWCVTCLINERVALSSARVREALAAGGVTYMKGDWTRQDPDITAFLRGLDRDGVPLYALFPPGGRSPELLPQILSEATVLAAIRRLDGT